MTAQSKNTRALVGGIVLIVIGAVCVLPLQRFVFGQPLAGLLYAPALILAGATLIRVALLRRNGFDEVATKVSRRGWTYTLISFGLMLLTLVAMIVVSVSGSCADCSGALPQTDVFAYGMMTNAIVSPILLVLLMAYKTSKASDAASDNFLDAGRDFSE